MIKLNKTLNYSTFVIKSNGKDIPECRFKYPIENLGFNYNDILIF